MHTRNLVATHAVPLRMQTDLDLSEKSLLAWPDMIYSGPQRMLLLYMCVRRIPARAVPVCSLCGWSRNSAQNRDQTFCYDTTFMKTGPVTPPAHPKVPSADDDAICIW